MLLGGHTVVSAELIFASLTTIDLINKTFTHDSRQTV